MNDRSQRGILGVLFILVVGFGIACASSRLKSSSSVKSFVDPSIQPGAIKSIAVFPLRNLRLQPDQFRDINRAITDAMRKQNPGLGIMGALESVSMLNEAELADKYSEALRNYAQSGIPDVGVLQEIGKALSIDAILWGEAFDVEQRDAAYKGDRGHTALALRYELVSTSNGSLLWQATGLAHEMSEKKGTPAPTYYNVAHTALQKVLSVLPTLAN